MSRAQGRRRAAAALACAGAALLLAAMLAVLSGCAQGGSQGSNGKALRVGVETGTVGFSFYNEKTGKYAGYEVDVATDLAERLGYNGVEFTGLATLDRRAMLENDEVDCLIACYSISDYREQFFDLSEPYYECSCIIMVEDSSLIAGVEDLRGLTVGSLAGADNEPRFVSKLVEMGLSNGEVLDASADGSVYYYDFFTSTQKETYQELSDALEAGTIDALLIDESAAYTYLAEGRSILDFEVSSANYGVAMRKGSDLTEPVSEAIRAMREDGTLDRLIDKWDIGGDRYDLWSR